MESNTEDHKQNSDPSKGSNDSDFSDTQQIIVPVLEEEYSISKETTSKEAKIEKRWVTKTRTIKVAASYEEVYINDKKMKLVE
jgi:stress response protein YsnF